MPYQIDPKALDNISPTTLEPSSQTFISPKGVHQNSVLIAISDYSSSILERN